MQVWPQLVGAAADGRTALIQNTDNGIFIVVGFQPCADGQAYADSPGKALQHNGCKAFFFFAN